MVAVKWVACRDKLKDLASQVWQAIQSAIPRDSRPEQHVSQMHRPCSCNRGVGGGKGRGRGGAGVSQMRRQGAQVNRQRG